MGQRTSVTIEEGWMSQSDAHRALGVTRNTVLARVARGRYRGKRVGGVLFVREEDVLKDVPKERGAGRLKTG